MAVQGASVGIFDWDIVRGTLYWSPLFRRMVGLAPGEEPIPRVTFGKLLHPGTGSGWRECSSGI